MEPTPFQAFHKAQSEFRTAIKDATNPHFRSRYADFASVYDAVRDALHTNGFIVTQPIQISDSGFPIVETIIRYKDGTEIERSQCPVVSKVQNDPQAMGSAITYARRYSLAAILCVVTDDDDAESATRSAEPTRPARPTATATKSTPEIDSAVRDYWINHFAPCQDVQDLNRAKKDIGAAKLDDTTFKAVWAMLTKKAKELGATYDKDNKVFK